ncbi:hypothetical protein KC363_g7253 [Hortaea werneckii]|nr:hypothetical protein KC363_g7253 [Hortaea werneckii]
MDIITDDIMDAFDLEPDVYQFLKSLQVEGPFRGVTRTTTAARVFIKCMKVYGSSAAAADKGIELAKTSPTTEERCCAIIKGLEKIFEALAVTRSPEAKPSDDVQEAVQNFDEAFRTIDLVNLRTHTTVQAVFWSFRYRLSDASANMIPVAIRKALVEMLERDVDIRNMLPDVESPPPPPVVAVCNPAFGTAWIARTMHNQ